VKISTTIALFLAAFWPLGLAPQPAKPTTLAELAVYSGADREHLLVAGARKEGKIVWYTALAGGSYKDLARAFEAKYGVPVEAYRGASRDLIAKVLAEAQAKLAASGQVFRRCQGRSGQGRGILGHRPRILHGFCLQQGQASRECSAEKL
jgi:hypothetical protein